MLIHIFHHKTAFDLCDYTSKPVQYCNSILLLTIIGFHIFLLDRLQCVSNFITCFKIQSILNLPKVKLNGLKETIEFLVVMRDCRKLNIIRCCCTGSFWSRPFRWMARGLYSCLYAILRLPKELGQGSNGGQLENRMVYLATILKLFYLIH